MKVVAVASLKGGVGKTSVSIFLAQLLSLKGKVLAIDLDHNNNLTDYYLRNTEVNTIESANVYHVISGKRKIEDCLYATGENTSGLKVLPATPHLARVGLELAHDPTAILRFARNIRSSEFDFVVIDTPPALCFELMCALYSAHVVLSPVSFTRWTVQGFSLLLDEVCKVSNATGKCPRLLALPTCLSSTQDKKLRMSDLAEFSKTSIGKSNAIKQSCDLGRELKENTRSYEEFANLAKELSV